MVHATRPGIHVADAGPLGVVMGGWKPHSPGVPPWRDFPRHALVLSVAGTARYADDRGREATLRPGDALLVFPGLRHWFLPDKAGWDEYFLIFSGPIFGPWMAEPLLGAERPVLHLGEVDYWLPRFAAVLGTQAQPAATTVLARLQLLLAEIVAVSAPGIDGPRQAWLDRARAMLADLAGRPSLGVIARRLGCSDQVFRKRFRELAGETPGAYRERARMEEACRLLPSVAVGEVAERLHFCDQFQFSRRFKARYGIPPRTFQRL
jgi:AraC-like DNA-binding protein